MIEVLEPGPLTTVQDGGRRGLAASGIPPSGAMDPWALRRANLLVANDEGAAGLEVTLRGPVLRFVHGAIVALTGARFDADVDGEPVRFDEAFPVWGGQTLTVGRAVEGVRCTLAVRGGITVEPVLGSRSTHVTAGIGPPVLAAGQTLPLGEAGDALPRIAERTPVGRDHVARAVRAPGSNGDLFDGPWLVGTRADRTGVRLEGRAIGGGEIDPAPMPRGAVQVPPDGAPILLGPDGPVTGGYPLAAVVIDADVGVFAYARPGDTLRFEEVTVEQARAARRAREEDLRRSIEMI